MAAQAVKSWGALTTAMLSMPKWGLRAFRTNMQTSMDDAGWKMMLPGVRSSASVTQLKDSMMVLHKLTDAELDDAKLVRGIRLRRLAKDSEKPIPYILDVMDRYHQTVMLHAYVNKQHRIGKALPDTMEETMLLMQFDPLAAVASRESRPQRARERKYHRRGY
ncbi:hypothetical protein M885DRAFT_520909 [Pelagophyceae sp. CCMP2097]|nr:hypothetical protein M885DRAFT_520909 [Pelagophyceae sp. CCMP2097]